jgi:mono/diheme cytochrome c family protein
MSVLTATFGGPAHRRATLVIGLILLLVALTLLTVGANSPYTHANLNSGYDDRYTRTEQIVVGPPQQFGGLSAQAVTSGDAVTRGAALFVTEGCVGCHALGGQGGAVAKPIAGVDEQLLAQRVRQGLNGMPQFSTVGLTDQQLADIGAYLRSLPPVK